MIIHKNNNRQYKIEVNNKTIATPFHFASISSIKTNYDIEEYLDVILKTGYPGFLASSYDIFGMNDEHLEKFVNKLSYANNKGILTLMDSGHYEAFWNRDKTWSFDNYSFILNKTQTDLCFSYDVNYDRAKKINNHKVETEKMVARTASVQQGSSTIPLLHCNIFDYPSFVHKLAKDINPEIIGIPERELGDSIIERCTNLKRIRDSLDKTDLKIPIHLLGTGNPASILMYTICGADLYDGLEWCKTVVDPSTAKLYHFVQKPLFKCECDYCNAETLPYALQTMAHNLRFFNDFTCEIRDAITHNEIDELLSRYLEPETVSKIKEIARL